MQIKQNFRDAFEIYGETLKNSVCKVFISFHEMFWTAKGFNKDIIAIQNN